MTRLTPLKSEGPRKPRRHTPPYWPISSAGTTIGLSGRRFSTGGSLPALTRAANSGASLYFIAGAAAFVGAALVSGAFFASPANADGAAINTHRQTIRKIADLFIIAPPLTVAPFVSRS